MRELNFWEFPADVRIHLDSGYNKIYWETVQQKAGSLRNAARILISCGLGEEPDRIYDAKKGRKSYAKSYKGKKEAVVEEVRFPVGYVLALEKEFGIDCRSLQDHIDSYSAGKSDKIIPELDGERKLPLIFDEELILALSSVMWSEIKTANIFTFTGPAEQRAWL